MKKYDYIVYIGRFQPLHNAHLEIIKMAERLSNNLIIICGSGFQPRTYKNPFTDKERKQMIENVTSKPCIIEFVRDTIYNDTKWATDIQEIVDKYTSESSNIALIGCEKDTSSFYLKMFPQWETILVDNIEQLHASDIRELYFKKKSNIKYLNFVMPMSTYSFLQDFMETPEYKIIVDEREHMERYRIPYNSLPYEICFVTADAIVIQSGHVLMVKRKAYPGKGLWALPGGFLDANSDKSMKHCMLRELKEETSIELSETTLERCITDSRVFDAIGRSFRGRTITHAFKLELKDGPLVKVKGSDDAEKAKWIPIAKLDSSLCFEDHYELIQWAVS